MEEPDSVSRAENEPETTQNDSVPDEPASSTDQAGGVEPQSPTVADEDDNDDDDNVQGDGEGNGNKASRKRKPEQPATWFELDDEHNTQVYVTNLPLDTTEEEFVALMKKCGYLIKDPETGQFKVKLYRDREGKLKGDGLCAYMKRESVDLAIQLLDESIFKQNTIRVERAKFTLKGDYDPTKKPKRSKKTKEKMKRAAERLLGWAPERLPGERARSDKVVIIKNMFDIKEFAVDPRLILEYRNDLREECGEKCGEVKKVDIFDNNPEGVAMVTFIDFEAAEKCIQLMDGRFFAGRQLVAHVWDGRTKYKIQETEEEIEKRMKEWSEYLEQGDEAKKS